PGDRIVAYDNHKNPSWEDLSQEIFLRPEEPIRLKVLRQGQQLDLTIKPHVRQIRNEKAGEAGIEPYMPRDHLDVVGVMSDKPAAAAGLKPDDKITAVNGQPIVSLYQLRESLQNGNGQPVTLKVDRNGNSLELQATPTLIDGDYKL